MPETMHSRFGFLRGKPVLAVTGLLIVEIVLFHSIPTKEYVPSPPPLEQLATSVGPWRAVGRDRPIDANTRDFLKADDTLTRDYAGPSNVELFVAFFKSQRAGVTPHSPKVCLPSNGWIEESAGTVSVRVPGEPAAILVNRYVVLYQDQRRLVMYWYQNPHRVTASEYLSKFYLIYDSLRYRRSDEALIRVVTDITGGADATRAEQHAIQFVQDVFQPLKRQMWFSSSNGSAPVSENRLP